MRQQLSLITTEGIYQEAGYFQLQKYASTTPAYSRAHDWLLLAGPLRQVCAARYAACSKESQLYQYTESLQMLTC